MSFDLSELYKEMTEVAAVDVPVISEAQFKTYILPELVKKNRGEKCNFENWHQIVGNPHREISVIDDSRNEIFRVPPILSRLPTDEERYSIGAAGISDLYHKRRGVENPASVDVWFTKMMEGLSPNVHDMDYVRYLKNNMIIYDRYGISMEDLLGEHVGTIKLKNQSGLYGTFGASKNKEGNKDPVAPTVDHSAKADSFDFDGELDDL